MKNPRPTFGVQIKTGIYLLRSLLKHNFTSNKSFVCDMKLWKYSGTFLWITGIIHIVVGFIMRKDIYVDMLHDGLINSIKNDFTRGFAFWFFFFGVLLALYGYTLQYNIKREKKPAPVHVGYGLLALGIFGCLAEPVSGFWLVLPQALIIIIANRKPVTS